MHSVDSTTEQMIRSVLAFAENRLRLDPVPLDKGSRDPAELDIALAGLIGEEGHPPDQVLGVYASMLAPAVISADSPRFLGFIPAAPTKASLLFDMLISCASIQGISWLEAAGAIHAENQVLALIADRGRDARRVWRLLRIWWFGGEPVRARRRPRGCQTEITGQGQAMARSRRLGGAFLGQQHIAAAGDGRLRGAHAGPPADRRCRTRRHRRRR